MTGVQIPMDVYESPREIVIIIPLGGVQKKSVEMYFEDYKFQSMTEAAIKLSMTTFGNSIIHYAVRPVVGSLIKSGVGATSETLGYVANSFLPGSGEIIKPVFSGAMNFLIPWTAAKITTVIAQNGLLCGADYVSDYLKAS